MSSFFQHYIHLKGYGKRVLKLSQHRIVSIRNRLNTHIGPVPPICLTIVRSNLSWMLLCLTHSTETLLHASFIKNLAFLPQCCVNLPSIKHGIKYLYFLRNCMGDRNSSVVTILVGMLLHWQISVHRHTDRQINNWQSTLWSLPQQKLSPSTHFAMMTHTYKLTLC